MSEPIRAALEELIAAEDALDRGTDSAKVRRLALAKIAAREVLAAPLQQETDKDGERYRWLRDDDRQSVATVQIFHDGRWSSFSQDELDDAINAAIAALPHKDGK